MKYPQSDERISFRDFHSCVSLELPIIKRKENIVYVKIIAWFMSDVYRQGQNNNTETKESYRNINKNAKSWIFWLIITAKTSGILVSWHLTLRLHHKQIQSSDAVSFSQAIYQLGFSHKEYSGVEEQSQRSVVKKVASVQLAWSGTFPRETHATKKFAWQEARACHANKQ